MQRGSVYVFEEVGKENNKSGENPNEPSAEMIQKAYETIYLFKWFFPEELIRQQLSKRSEPKGIY